MKELSRTGGVLYNHQLACSQIERSEKRSHHKIFDASNVSIRYPFRSSANTINSADKQGRLSLSY